MLNFIGPFLIGVGLGINVLNVLNYSTGNTYKDGQIDAIQGKVEYELKLQADGTTDWVKIK